jgi:probable rRNA maturation factor
MPPLRVLKTLRVCPYRIPWERKHLRERNLEMRAPRVSLAIQLDPQIEAEIDEERLHHLAVETLRLVRKGSWGKGVAQSFELGLFITDDEGIKELNRRYRGIDEPTDVLAFGGEAEGFVSPPDEPHLGDIIISFPQAASQAQERGHSVAQEIDLLFLHGLLHLLGYEGETPEARVRMWARQEEVLGTLR